MAELFIAVLGASNLTYADASWTQSLPDWIGAHVRMFPTLWSNRHQTNGLLSEFKGL
jgi:transposase